MCVCVCVWIECCGKRDNFERSNSVASSSLRRVYLHASAGIWMCRCIITPLFFSLSLFREARHVSPFLHFSREIIYWKRSTIYSRVFFFNKFRKKFTDIKHALMQHVPPPSPRFYNSIQSN